MRILFIIVDTSILAMSSARSSLLPKHGNSPSVSKSTIRPRSSRTGFTFAYLIADRLSAACERPAMPQASVRSTSRSCSAISIAS